MVWRVSGNPVLMGERVEWGNEYLMFPGTYEANMGERWARESAAAHSQYRRLVKRTVIESDWEVVNSE